MFSLQTSTGDWARMRNGARFVYSSRVLARLAARHLAKTHGRLDVVHA